jgi:EmrB/QacA subfamily drug resistance transporter
MSPNTIKQFITPLTVSLAIFMEAVDTTIINTAIPSMSQSLQIGPVDLKIALISYLLSLAIFIPISGWLADKYGTKKIFLIAISIFTISSITCGFSTTLYELVISRFLQGTGGALMIPVGRLIVIRLFKRSELIQVNNRIMIPALIGPGLGPLLGGIISQAFSWRWIFWVNIPFGIINFILTYFWVDNFKTEKISPFDWFGFFLFGTGLAGFVFAFSALSESDFPLNLITIIFLIAIVFLICYAFHSFHCQHSVLKMKLFLTRTFRISVIGNLSVRIGFAGIPFLLPLFLQIGLGYSPRSAGLMVAITAIGAMAMKFFNRWTIKTFGFRKLLLINNLFLGLSLWLFMWVYPDTSWLLIALFTFIYGVLSSQQFGTMNPLAYADLPREDLGAATSIMSVVQQVASSFGVAATALILKRFDFLSTTKHILTLNDFHHTFFVLGILTMLVVFIFAQLKKDDGQNLIYKKNIVETS